MKAVKQPVYTFATPMNGRVQLSKPHQGDQIAIRPLAPNKTKEPYSLPAPILGWATTSSGLSLYTPSVSTSAAFRSALEEDAEEYFFTPVVPATLNELIVNQYPIGQLVYYRAAEQVATTLRKAA